MKIIEIHLDCDDYFLDGDGVSFNNYAVINDRKQIYRNGENLQLKEKYLWTFRE